MNDSTQHDAEVRQEQLLDGSLEIICETYRAALTEGMSAPVVFLLDCDDPIGSDIARAWRGDDAVDNALATAASDNDDPDEATILATANPFRDCASDVPVVFPYLTDSFQAPPPDGEFLVIVVTAGGAATYTLAL